MKIKIWLTATMAITALQLQAQSHLDYLRYSMLSYGSTSRSLAMGNSFGALGADISTLTTNPAGLGLFRRSEMSVSPTFSNRNVESDFEGTVSDDDHFKFSLGNFGLVLSNKKKERGLKYINFGIGYNRTNNFSSDEFAEYNNSQNTLIDSYVEKLNTGAFVSPLDLSTYYPFDKSLAWETYLLNFDTISNLYSSSIPYAGTRQRQIIERRGGQGEWAFSMATNYDDRLYIGATLGIPVVRYEEEYLWTEEDRRDTIPFFDNYRYNTSIATTGSGINFKVGAIYRASDFLRLGVAIHTPTWYYLTDDYRAVMGSNLESMGMHEWAGPDFIPFEYRITTPFRVISSIALVAGKSGALNIEYEFLDYSQGKIKPRDGQFQADFTDENRTIDGRYGAQHNIRAGVELPSGNFRFRFGGEYGTSPFDKNLRPDDSDIDMSRYSITGGIGYRADKFYIDAAYAWTRSGSFIYAYEMTVIPSQSPGIRSQLTDNRVQFTVGWLF